MSNTYYYLLILNFWITIKISKFKYHNQWVFHFIISTIQRTDRGAENKRSKTNRSRESWRMESKKNFKQKKNMKGSKKLGVMKEVYSKI